MPDALYVYGIVKFGFDLDWKESGINKENVYTVSEGKFSALVHNCEEKPYSSKDPNVIKELVIAHNRTLDRAMEDFDGVIPLHFNTIIKKGNISSEDNLKNWVNENKDRLEKVWDKIKGKKEYGIRIYYEKNKLVQEISTTSEIKDIEETQKGKGRGLSYLLQGKISSKINELTLNRINKFKQNFHNAIKKITEDVKINISRIFIDEEKDLLLSLSVLVDEQQIAKTKKILEKKTGKDFSYQLAGPFVPYSFVEDETKQ